MGCRWGAAGADAPLPPLPQPLPAPVADSQPWRAPARLVWGWAGMWATGRAVEMLGRAHRGKREGLGRGRVPGPLTWRAGLTQQLQTRLGPTLPTYVARGLAGLSRAYLVWPDPWGPSSPALQPPASMGSRAQPQVPASLDVPPLSFLFGAGGAAGLGIGPLSLETSGALFGAQGPSPPAQMQGLRWPFPT